MVADEVRKLAERTSASTRQIAEMIRVIQSDTAAVVECMQAVSPQVASGVCVVNQVATALASIDHDSAGMLDKVRDVAHSTCEQSVANSSVAGNVERISHMAESSNHSVRSAKDRVDELAVLSQSLRDAVACFQL